MSFNIVGHGHDAFPVKVESKSHIDTTTGVASTVDHCDLTLPNIVDLTIEVKMEDTSADPVQSHGIPRDLFQEDDTIDISSSSSSSSSESSIERDSLYSRDATMTTVRTQGKYKPWAFKPPNRIYRPVQCDQWDDQSLVSRLTNCDEPFTCLECTCDSLSQCDDEENSCSECSKWAARY
jgi:hypothetical protein